MRRNLNFIEFDAFLTPIALGRPHVNTQTKLSYLRKADINFRDNLAWIAQLEMKAQKKFPLEGAVAADVKIYRNFPVTSKNFGDVDNHLKAVFDALNGICYTDDSQIVSVHCEKHRSREEFLRLRFSKIF